MFQTKQTTVVYRPRQRQPQLILHQMIRFFRSIKWRIETNSVLQVGYSSGKAVVWTSPN